MTQFRLKYQLYLCSSCYNMGVKGIILSLLMTNMIKRFFIHEVKWKNGFTAFRQMVAGVIANDLTSGTALR